MTIPFHSTRATHSYTLKLNAPAAVAFPLLCPTREYEWIDGWRCKLIYSQSGFAEENCVFTTDFPNQGGAEVWVVSHYEPNREIQFVRVNELRTIRFSITLNDKGDGTTEAKWKQTFTGLSEAGNRWIEQFTADKFQQMIQLREKMLNHFLATNKMLIM
jgi:hypothetical protein